VEEELKIGQYILIRRIGAGGMAEVWEARHLHLGHTLAVKFLLPEFTRNLELQERFLNEGKRQAQLQHPNIVPAIDFFQIDGRSYLVMQFVDGSDLETRLQKDKPPLNTEEIHAISWDVLSALDHAHSLGVIHRDVKPANMLQDRNGRTLLMDFGIAKALREEHNATLTRTSMGTPDYMSPEQIVSTRTVDARADIYSFGCVLYAMLTGKPPFSSDDATDFHIQDCHVRATPAPPVFANPDVPPAVGAVVLRCLEKKPADRYQNCREVMAALDDAIAAKPAQAVSGSSPEKSYPKTEAPVFPVRMETISAVSVEPAPVAQEFKVSSPTIFPPAQNRLPAKRSKLLLGAGIATAAVACILFFALRPWLTHLQRLEAKDWSQVRYDDADLRDCLGVDACKQKSLQLTRLITQDWRNARFDNPLLQDCMREPSCVERKSRLDALKATDWQHANAKLHVDCMGYDQCLETKPQKAQKQPGSPREPDEDNLPDCCKDDACRRAKKEMGLQDNCISLMNHPQ
jgi:serine/threonine protein kinase